MSITFAANGTRISNWMQNITTEFTMSTWVKTTSTGSTLVIFETSTNYNFTNGAWIFYVHPTSGGGQVSYSIGGSTVHAANLTSAEVGAWNDGNWHHWVVSGRRNAGDTGAESWRVWFDGTQITLANAASNPSAANFANQTMHISARNLTALDFVGSHSDIALWNFFDPDDNFVKSLYYGMPVKHVRPESLVRYLPLTEDSDLSKSTGDNNGAQEVIIGANRLYYGNYTWDDDEPHVKSLAPVMYVNVGGEYPSEGGGESGGGSGGNVTIGNSVLTGSGNRLAYNSYSGTNTLYAALGSGYSLSTEVATISGIPLTLYKKNNSYAIAIVDESTVSSSSEILTFGGIPLELALDSSNRKILKVVTGSGSLSRDIYWGGVNLGVNSNSQLIFVQATPSGTLAETSVVTINGVPLKCVRYGTKWYLSANIN